MDASEHWPELFRRAWWLLKNREDAEDATQATMLRAHLSSKKPESERAWLWTILKHETLAVRRLRKRKTDAATGYLADEDEESEAFTSNESPERTSLSNEAFRLVHTNLRHLTPVYREALTLCYLDGMSHSEAAAAVGVGRDTMGARVTRGKRALRQILEAR